MQILPMVCLLVSAWFQAPAAESGHGTEISAEWQKLQRLAGGEWNASGEGAPPRFHRFRFGPGERSLWAHTRNAQELGTWPKSETVYYWHPALKTIKAIGVSDNGSLFDGTLHWNEEVLQTDFAYHVPDNNRFDYISRWSFEGRKAYNWKLFAKSEAGLSEAMTVRFDHSKELRPLPEIAPPIFQPIPRLKFLKRLTGPWKESADKQAASNASVQFQWAAGGHVLLIRRTGTKRAKQHSSEGMVFWHPEAAEIRYIQIDDQGTLIEGKVQAEDDAILLHVDRFIGDSKDQIVERWTGNEALGLTVERNHTSSEGVKATRRVLTRLE